MKKTIFQFDLLRWSEPQLLLDGKMSAAEYFRCSVTTLSDLTRFEVTPLDNKNEFQDFCCCICFEDVLCDAVSVQGDSMGSCRMLAGGTEDQEFVSANLLVIKSGIRFYLLEFDGFPAGEVCWCGKFNGNILTELRAELRENIASRPLEKFALELRSGENPQVLLENWAKRHYSANTERCFNTTVLEGAGWNSWDYFRWSVTAEDVLRNAEFIARDAVLSKYIKRIVIDDGWMNCYGEWEGNSRFANMRKLSSDLRKMGFTPGLWFAPALAEPQSMIAQQHWEYLARGESNWPCLSFECMSRRAFVLDPTQKEVQRFWGDTFRRYKEMDFGYFKLDFLKHVFSARYFADRRASANDIMNIMLQTIRNAVGSNCALMACNYLYAAGNKYVDMVRTASDIHADFASIRHNSSAIAARGFMQDIIWRNDPDFALARGVDTSNDPNMDRLRPNQVFIQKKSSEYDDLLGKWCCASSLRGEEAKILLSLVIVSGGEVNFSDDLTKLNEYGLELVRKTAAAEKGFAACAQDLYLHEYAEVYLQKICKNKQRKLWINWQDDVRSFVFDLPENAANIRDFWSGEVLNTLPDTLNIAPHSCRLIEYMI